MVNVDDMQRRSNICIVGIPKGEESKDPHTNNRN